MRTKLMALLLAAGLGVTGVAMTAQAAEAGTRAENECAHSKEFLKRTDVMEAINMNDGRHYVTYRRTYFCPDCGLNEVKWETIYELHDYEQIYYADGSVQSYCTVCDESYYW